MDALEQVMRERVVKSLCLSIITLGIQSQAYAIPAMPADANMDRLPLHPSKKKKTKTEKKKKISTTK